MAIINVRNYGVGTSSQDEVTILNQSVANLSAVIEALAITQLSDVTINTPLNGQALVYNSVSGEWENQVVSTVGVLGDLTDVDLTGLVDGNYIAYNSISGNWEVSAPAAGATTLPQLTDVTIASLADNDLLVYNSVTGQWENGTAVQDLTVAGTLSTTQITDTGASGVKISFDENAGGYFRLENTHPTVGNTCILNTWQFLPGNVLQGFDVRTSAFNLMFRATARDTGGGFGTHDGEYFFLGDKITVYGKNAANNAIVPIEFDKIAANTIGIPQGSGQISFRDTSDNPMFNVAPGAWETPSSYGGKINIRTTASTQAYGDSGVAFTTTGNNAKIDIQADGNISINGQNGSYLDQDSIDHGVTLWGHQSLGLTVARDETYLGKPTQLANIPVGTTAPVTPNPFDFWLDTSAGAGLEQMKTYRDVGAGLTWINVDAQKNGHTFYDSTNHRIITMVNSAWVALTTTSL